ncbi:hypothetical protein G7Y89_g10263 [Cudoniella acicularis]|uniref:Major facilitator superfamily (MFS) profile domain-containing protein n=1 Tax=Cudoniella acicularis TaxID=354080 RepID=A0A8H4RD40_9HELO|nr:hypothetical protein G7Y89_g10263 [Cudoniella acicularis]
MDGRLELEEEKQDAPSQESVEISEVVNWKPSRRELLVMISLAVINLMISLDATIVVTSISTIVADLKGTATQGFWVGTSYLLVSAVTMPVLAALSEIFGRPSCLLASLGFFTLGTILCCTAQHIDSLLIGRSIQGIGGGGITILGLVIFTDIVPLRFRSKWYGVIQGAWALGCCIGPVVGGAIVEHTTWRAIFYVMFPFCLFGFVVIPPLLTLKLPKTTLKERLLRVDWFGSFIFIASSTSFLIAITWGGTEEPWGSFRTLLPLILGASGLLATGIWEAYGAREPFLRRSLFYCSSSYAAFIGAMVQGLLLYGQLYYIPLFFLSVSHASPVRTGVYLLPIMLALIPTSIVIGALVTRLGRFRWAIWSGWAIMTLGSGITILWTTNTSTATLLGTSVILGVGHGLVLNAQNFATQAICKPREEGYAAAMYAFMRGSGMAIGVGIGGSVFQNVFRSKLIALDLDPTIAMNFEAFIFEMASLPDADEMKIKVLQACTFGFHGVYGFYTGQDKALPGGYGEGTREIIRIVT